MKYNRNSYALRQLLFNSLMIAMMLSSCSCSKESSDRVKGNPIPTTVEWITDEQIPIVAWHSVDLISSSLRAFQEVKEGGYTISLSTIWGGEDPKTTYNANLLEVALNYADQVGIKVIAGCYELTTDTENTVRRFMNHPSVVGWFLKDEPSTIAEFEELAALAGKIRSVDSKHFIYVNLRPADTKNIAINYETYLNEFIRIVPTEFISFDKYPCQVDNDGNIYVLDSWYGGLQMIADAAKNAKKDFWAFASAIKFESAQATPSMQTLRLQMYTNLAYGAQGLQYFVYRAPSSPDYTLVKIMNKEIQNFAKVFLGAKVISVTHTGETIPSNTIRFNETPDVVKTLTTGNAGAIVSVLEKGTRKFLVIVSRDINNSLPVTIAFDRPLQQVTKMGTLVRVEGKVSENVPPGDILIYTWNK